MADEHGLLGPPKTANYRPSFVPGPEWAMSGIGLFNNRIVDDMRRDPQVSLCLGYKKSIVFTAEFDYEANSPEIKRFVEENHQRFWRKGLPIALEKLAYGYTGSESMYRFADGKYQWDYLKPIYPSDALPWTVKGKLAYLTVGSGMLSVLGGRSWNANKEKDEEDDDDRAISGSVKLRAATSQKPGKGLWFVHDNIYSQWFGRSCLAPAWTPWRWKTMPDGANEIIAKWYFRHSFSGMEVRYPNVSFQDETTGRIITGQEYARQLATMTKAGAGIVLPSDYDENGHPLWEIKQYAKIEGSASNLLEWVNAYLDVQIQRAIDIPDELITHQGNTGGYSRSQVSLTTFLQGSDRLVDAANEEYDDQVMRGLVHLNFGAKAKYRIKPKSFIPKEPGAGGPFPGGVGGAIPGAAAPALPGAATPALPALGDPTAAVPPADAAANPLAGLFGAPDAGGAEAAAVPGAGADEPPPTDTAAPAPDEEPAPPAAATGGPNQAESVQGQDMRQTVGGLNAVKDLQESFYAGKMPRSAVIANVKLLFGFTDDEAAGLFPQETPEHAVEQPSQLSFYDVIDLSWTAIPIQHKDGSPGVKAVNERGRELYGKDAERVLAHQADLLRRATLKQKPTPVSKDTLDDLGKHIDAANADRDREYDGGWPTGDYKEPLAATAPGGRKPLEETGPHQALEETGENAKPETPDDAPTPDDLAFELDDDSAEEMPVSDLSPETQAAFERDIDAIMKGERPEETKYFAPRGGAKIKGQRFEPGVEIPAEVVARIPLKKRKLLDVKKEPVTFNDVAKKVGGSAFKAGAHAIHGLNKIAKQGLRVVKGDETLAHAAKRTAQKVSLKYQRLEQRYGRAAAVAMVGAYVGSYVLWGTNPAVAAVVAPEPMVQLVGIAEGIKRLKQRISPTEVELSQFSAWLAEKREDERAN